MNATPQNVRYVATGLDHPECINFGPDGLLYAGGEAGQIYRIDTMSGAVSEYARAEGFLMLGVTLDGSGNVYGCSVGRREVVKVTPDGSGSCFSRGVAGTPLVTPNYSVFDGAGNLYFSDSGDYFSPTGRLYVVRANGVTEIFHAGPLKFPNGLAIDPAEEFLYVIQSTGPDIIRLPLRNASPTLEPEVYLKLPGVVPDGMAFDRTGKLVISCYVPDRILIADARGKVDILMNDPWAELLNRPTNVALGKKCVYFANLGGWHVGRLDADVDPMPLRYPEL